jgi:hypothetical protein
VDPVVLFDEKTRGRKSREIVPLNSKDYEWHLAVLALSQ